MNRLTYLKKRLKTLEKRKDKIEKIYDYSYQKLMGVDNDIFDVESEIIQLGKECKYEKF